MRNRRDILAFAVAGVLAAGLPAGAAARPVRLVFVHGRGQGGQDPAQLQAQWLEALSLGAHNLGRVLPNSIQVAFPYYGDALDRFVREFDLPLTSDIQARGGGADNDFLAFQADMAQAVRQKAGVTDDEVAAEYGDKPGPRGPLNWEWVQAIFRAIDKHGGGMSQAALEGFTRDVFLYTTRTGVRDAIDDIVKMQVTDQPTVVVGHSLGAIVAYNVLRSDSRTLRVPLLVTVGSPLGIRAVRDQLVPLKFPNSVHTWYNAFDSRDVVALYPLDNANFPVTPPIVNNGSVKTTLTTAMESWVISTTRQLPSKSWMHWTTKPGTGARGPKSCPELPWGFRNPEPPVSNLYAAPLIRPVEVVHPELWFLLVKSLTRTSSADDP